MSENYENYESFESGVSRSEHADADGQCEDESIDIATKFWMHPAVSAFSPQEKLDYLRKRHTLSNETLQKIRERVASLTSDSKHRTTKQVREPTSTGISQYNPPPPGDLMFTTIDPAYISALLGLGGFLGLMAAATLRWLNGGDFVFFPHAYVKDAREEQVTSRCDEASVTDEYEPMENEDGKDYQGYRDCRGVTRIDEVSRKLDNLVERMETAIQQQNEVLQKWVNHAAKGVTDQSMDLLRKKQSEVVFEHPQSSELQGLADQVSSQIQTFDTDIDQSDCHHSQVKEIKSDLRQLLEKIRSIERNSKTRSSPTKQTSSQTASLTTRSNEHEMQETARNAIEHLIHENHQDSNLLRTGTQLLYMYMNNLVKNPSTQRYRKIFTNSASFKKTDLLVGARDLLYALNFVETTSKACLEWTPEPLDERRALLQVEAVAAALEKLKTHSDKCTAEDLVDLALGAMKLFESDKKPKIPGSYERRQSSSTKNFRVGEDVHEVLNEGSTNARGMDITT